MMIQAVLGNPHHPEYGVATIPFPIPRDQHAHCMELLEALEIGDAVKADCKVEKIDSFYTVLKRVEMLTVNPLSGIRFLLESSADQVNWQEVSAAETGADGAVCWENLTADGSTYYRVTEVQTAEGMTLLTEPLFVGTLDAGSHDITITACNNAGFALPFTGGTGFTIYILFAALMLCMGVYFCKKSTTKKEN